MINPLIASLTRNQGSFHPVVSFTPGSDTLSALNLTQNGDLPVGIADDLERFVTFMQTLRETKAARYLIGGYDELRFMYSRSTLFNEGTFTLPLIQNELRLKFLGMATTFA